MLRSTGFFRGIDCPFYADYSDGKGGKNGCNRPYCHFRHSQQRRLSYGAPEIKKQKEQGYDPFNPEVVHPAEPQNENPAPESGDITGALALVNRAIEEVRTQMEREKRKLSRIGDEPYDPSENSALESGTPQTSTSHEGYDPGNYQMTSGEYNPTPGCSKYTIDSNTQGNSTNSMEYVPALVKKPVPRTQTKLLSSPPRYSNNTSSKYTLDKSKPSTDMEYDPLSNYSASVTGKSKKGKTIAQSGKTESSKGQKTSSSYEEYVVTVVKKPPPSNSNKYTFSDSEEDGSSTEYRPTLISNLQLKKDYSDVGKDKKVRTQSLNALTEMIKEDLIDLTKQDVQHKSSLEKKKLDSCKDDNKHKETSKLNKTSSSGKSGSSRKDKVSKSSSHDVSKKENKSQGKKEDRSKDKIKINKEVVKEERKIKPGEKVKVDSSNKRERDTENVASESKKPKLLDKEKDRHHKNGKLESSRSPKDLRKDGKSSLSSSNSKGKLSSSKDQIKQSSSGKKDKKERQQSLSHVDLFGDESPEEAEPMDYDDDDEPEEKLIRKSANALKRGRLEKRKASELTLSSSEDEADGAVVSSTAAKEEVESMGIDLSEFQDDIDFDSDPIEECLRIFNESKDVKKEDKGRQTKQPSRDSDEERDTESTLTTLFPGQKKRVSHFVAKGNAETPKAVVRPYKRPTAQEVCYQRMQLSQQQAAQLKSASPSPSLSREKKRIAHRPNPQLASTKTGPGSSKANTSRVLSLSQSQPSVKVQTTAGIMSKTSSTVLQRRVAHTPTLKSSSMKRPVIPTEFGAKVPTNIRQRYLNTFIDECLKFCRSEEAAFQMALDEEKIVYERSNSKNIYLNVAVNTLKKLRSKSSTSLTPVSKQPVSATNKRAQSHEEVLGGRLAATTSFTVNRSGKHTEEKLTGSTLYRKLKAYLMTEEQLQEHGYPRKNPSSGRALIYNLPEKKAPLDALTKICCRCGTEYKVNANGSCVRKEECNYHWGRARRHKVAGGWETSYNCCSGAVGSLGCQVSKQHVQDGRKESLDGFVSTFSKPLPLDGNAGVFALDCEMCYTKQGLELTRVTVIDSDLKVVYDTFVKPDSKVVDYNTRFSGVTQEDLENVCISLRDVQAVLLNMFSAESILLGHSLESDLLALKLIHSSVVDTAIVFPHRLGLPYKRALRNLMADHLKRIIQDSVGGHDSSEDASACMELMIWKIKEDAKLKR